MPTINFDVSGETITANPASMSVESGDEIDFTTNETVYVTFNEGTWPFSEPEVQITVNPGTGAGPYTVVSTGTLGSYSVSTEPQQRTPSGATASGEIDPN